MREKMSKQPPPAPIASAIGPCPTIIQINRTPLHWKLMSLVMTNCALLFFSMFSVMLADAFQDGDYSIPNKVSL